LTTGRIAAIYGRFNGIRHVAPVCTAVHRHLIHAFLSPPESESQTPSGSFQPFFAGLTAVTDRQTYRPTDHTIRSVAIGRIYVRSTTMRPNNNTAVCISLRRRGADTDFGIKPRFKILRELSCRIAAYK